MDPLLCVGGIKPCVMSLGADQFKVPEQVKQMASYFAMFYASINFGSMISTIVTPLIRCISRLQLNGLEHSVGGLSVWERILVTPWPSESPPF